jgi:hypothetical protein
VQRGGGSSLLLLLLLLMLVVALLLLPAALVVTVLGLALGQAACGGFCVPWVPPSSACGVQIAEGMASRQWKGSWIPLARRLSAGCLHVCDIASLMTCMMPMRMGRVGWVLHGILTLGCWDCMHAPEMSSGAPSSSSSAEACSNSAALCCLATSSSNLSDWRPAWGRMQAIE